MVSKPKRPPQKLHCHENLKSHILNESLKNVAKLSYLAFMINQNHIDKEIKSKLNYGKNHEKFWLEVREAKTLC
jgi:hypothetical protein